MSTTLQKITARAKAIRKKHPSKKWTDCIKAASRELKSSGAIGVSKPAKRSKRKVSGVKKTHRQTGSSNKKRDVARVAKAPGKRVVKHAKVKSTVYYERRKNRADAPGKLSGLSVATIKNALRARVEDKLGKAFVAKTKATTKTAKRKLQKGMSLLTAELRKLK